MQRLETRGQSWPHIVAARSQILIDARGIDPGGEKRIALRSERLAAIGLRNPDIANQHPLTSPEKSTAIVEPYDVFRNGFPCAILISNGSVPAPPENRPFSCRTGSRLVTSEPERWQDTPMAKLTFIRLNDGWNAEPNAPEPRVAVATSTVSVNFLLNPWAYEADEEEVGILSFDGCRSWRLGATNDEGWYLGQCRYSTVAPAWGELYEIVGSDLLAEQPNDWHPVPIVGTGHRHFLFYLRDQTFECFAADWSFRREPPGSKVRQGSSRL